MSSPDTYASELRLYLFGLGTALVLSAIPFGLVAFTSLSRLTLLIVIAACAIVQVIAHFRFFLHIDLSRQNRDDLQLILFSSLIVILMVSGTIWIISNQIGMMM